MARKPKLELQGDKKLIRKMKRLGNKKILRKVVRQATNAAATPIVKAVRSIWHNEARDTGLSEKAVTKKIVRTKSGFTAVIGIDKDVSGESNGHVHIPSNIDHLVELGYQLKGGTTVPAVAPLRRGYESGKAASLAAFESKAKEALEKEATKH